MNIPPRYSYCVLATVVLAVISYFIFPVIAIGILIGGLVSPLFANCGVAAKQTVSPASIPTPAKSSAAAPAVEADTDDSIVMTRAEYAGEVKTFMSAICLTVLMRQQSVSYSRNMAWCWQCGWARIGIQENVAGMVLSRCQLMLQMPL